jgi:Glycosyltransferase
MKILVNTPDINGLGGVANHYAGLKNYWNYDVRYNSLGSKKWRRILTPITILKYVFHLLFFRPNVVLLNPSLGKGALTRDFFYLKISRLFQKKTVMFIHGFSLEYALKADWKWIKGNLNQTNGIIVLAQSFKDELIHRGITAPIFLSTTKVLDTLIDDYDITQRIGEINNILFLSRIEKAKGIYETVDTFALLKHKYPDLTLTFVGDGSELTTLKEYVSNKKLQDVRFTGELKGGKLINEYKNADIFFFPSYGEGMPTVVLEAMAFGLPIITRKVGGLCDFFEDGKMGKITDSMNASDYAEMIKPFIENKSLTKKVSLYNHQYAKEHFMASIVAKNIENILRSL